MKKALLFFLLSILMGIVWLSTFLIYFIDTEASIDVLLPIRFFSFLASAITFLISFVLFLKKHHPDKSTLSKLEITSIITASLFTISMLTYGDIEVNILFNVLTILLVGFVSIALFFINIVTIFIEGDKKYINKLFIINLLLIIYPVYNVTLITFLMGIGFGPPS